MTNPAVEALNDGYEPYGAEWEKDLMHHPKSFLIELIRSQGKEFDALRAQAEQTSIAVSGETSDGYHTFNELYRFRKLYNSALFNEWSALGKFSVHKSKRHHDGEECFGGGWFIVVAVLPGGQISNHYELSDWDLFRVPEFEKALFEFDGHSASDVADRLESLVLVSPPPSGAKASVRKAGRWVSEELFESILRCVKRAGKEEDYQALRASPSFPKEGES